VVLAETVDLASRFSTDGSGRFVNGLLARVAREVRPGAEDVLASIVDDDLEDRPDPLVDGFVIDLDGVIRHWDPDFLGEHEARLGLPTGSIGSAAFEPARLERAMDGRLPFEGWAAEIGQAVAEAHGASADDVAEAWAEARWNIDLNVIELLQEIREVVPVALLSNASTRLREDLEASGIDDAFDAIVGSADVGAAKPSAAAFEAAAAAIGIPADRCCFVDDVEANVDGARATGMRAERFTDVDALRELVTELGLI
jgi:putative hydrolase of the HAD superfamily